MIYNNRMRATKTTHIFEVGSSSVTFTSNFDSGNLRLVTQTSAHTFLVESAIDSYQIPVSQKSFFHFSLQNYPLDSPIHIIVKEVHLLQSIPKQNLHRYLPFTSLNGHDYARMSAEAISITTESTIPTLHIRTIITNKKHYFSFALPYSYERYLNLIRDLPQSSEEIYIKKEVLCYSNNLNLVYMVTITSNRNGRESEETICETGNGLILPERHLSRERTTFDRPVILISGRVHPGESPSSWAIEGIIKFLLSGAEQAVSLRQHFQVVIVPMLNPDGVYEGLYRLDTRGHNLNRYYLISDNRQPSIYSMKHLIRHYGQTKKLLYYMDFHGHPSFKGLFLYGNAIDHIAFQTQTELFSKLLSFRSPTFEEKYCIFDRDQMYSKDKHDTYTKEGCARVFAFKTSHILHSYTIQMGFHSVSESKKGVFDYGQKEYYEEGVAIMSTILETTSLKGVDIMKKKELRKGIASGILIREERFKKEDKHIQQKRINVNEIIEKMYWKDIYERFFREEWRNNIAKAKIKIKNRTYIQTQKYSTYSKPFTCHPIHHCSSPTHNNQVAQIYFQPVPMPMSMPTPMPAPMPMPQENTIQPFLQTIIQNHKHKYTLNNLKFTHQEQKHEKNNFSESKRKKFSLKAVSKILNFSNEKPEREEIKNENSENKLKAVKKNPFQKFMEKKVQQQECSMFNDSMIRKDEKYLSFAFSNEQSTELIREHKSMIQKKSHS